MNDLDSLIEREIQHMRRHPRPQLQPAPEPNAQGALTRMVNAAMPSVVRDMKARRARTQEIEKANAKQEAATPIFAPPQASSGFDGDVQYEQSDPEFI